MKKLLLYLVMVIISIFVSCDLKEDGTTDDGTDDPTTPTEETISVTAPTSGDTLYTASSFEIKWTSNTSQNLIIDFTTNNGNTWERLATDIEDVGNYNWGPVPNTVSDECRVRVQTVDSSVVDISDGFFSIVKLSNREITVTAPNGGETWTGNTAQTITWQSEEVESVSIEYTINNGVNWNVIVENTPSDGYYTWDPVPNTPSKNARIRITDLGEGISDVSDNLFTIDPELEIKVTQPNGGEEWLAGSSQYIRWSTGIPVPPAIPGQIEAERTGVRKISKNKSIKSTSAAVKNTKAGNTAVKDPDLLTSIDNVKIEYSTNNGASWELITESTTNNGSFLWSNIPSLNSTLCVVRISDVDDGVPFDVSDQSFTIFTDLPQEIEITVPNGGESWPAGSSQDIKWNSTGVANVKIEYTINNGVNWNVIVESTPSDGFFTWAQIPATASTNCKVRITDVADGDPFDVSNGFFEIAPEPNVTVLSPNGGETWQVDDEKEITWTSENVANVKIELTTNGGAVWNVLTESTESDGSFKWTVVDGINSSLCKIKISDAADAVPSDISDGNFSITNQAVQNINIVAPNGGEDWKSGNSEEIIWTSLYIDSVKIELTTNNGKDWDTIVESIENTEVYQWSVKEVNSKACKIRVSDTDGDPTSISDATFSIRPVPLVEVLSPNGGETWEAGVPDTIKWKSEGIDEVRLEYSLDNGLTWVEIVGKTESDGEYVVGFSQPSTDYKIAISEAVEGSPRDESDGVFTVAPQTKLVIISPNGGERWQSGSNQYIQWTTSSGGGFKPIIGGKEHTQNAGGDKLQNVKNVKIDFTINGGATWETITNSTLNNGFYLWENIPPRNSNICKVRISDETDGIPTDLSDEPFTIYSDSLQLITVTSPNGGEVWQVGTDQEITWNSTEVINVDIDYTTNNGVDWISIVTNTPSDGYYSWTVPNTVSTNCRVRISDALDGSPADLSDNFFVIDNEPSIQVLEPNGGEVIVAGLTTSIKWTSTNIQKVKIEFTTNNGAEWISIVDSTESDGQYTWDSVPDTIVSELCRIRISDAKDGRPFDISDDNFQITNGTLEEIEVTQPNGGEVWNAGTTQEIKWTSFGISNVKIDYTTNNGKSWEVVTTNTEADGFFSWNPVPSVTSTNCRIRVSDIDGTPHDESDGLFTIAPEPFVSVITPSAGESFLNGTSTTITWTSENVESVKIEYTTNGGANWATIIASTPSTGSFLWSNIPEQGVTTNSSLCQIRISDAEDGTPYDITNGYFSITNQITKTLTVTAPNGGEVYEAGTTQNITWQATNVSNVDIDFTTNNGLSWQLIVAGVESSGAYEWKIPLNLNSPQCKVRVKDSIDDDPIDESNATFTIKPAQSIQVTNPVGGEVYNAGEPIAIEWDATGIENVGIRYTTTNGLGSSSEPAFYTVTESTPNNGEYLTSFSIPSNEYYVEVYDASDGSPRSRTVGNFTILPQQTNSITIISPNGKETWQSGEAHEIRWVSQGVELVTIEYSTDGGSVWNIIVDNYQSTGTYSWIVPVIPLRSDNCLLKITNSASISIFDISDAQFSILPPQQFVRVVTPNGGEEWDYNIGQVIEWESSGNVGFVDIYFSYDNGNNYEVVIRDFPSYGAYEWDPPNINVSLGRIKITVAGNPSVSDISDNPFKLLNVIDPPLPFITFVSPLKDQTWTIGTNEDICWRNSSDIVQVNIDYSVDNGVTWTNITANYVETPWNDQNCFTWLVAGPASSVSRIRIQGLDAGGNTVLEQISEPFIIQ